MPITATQKSWLRDLLSTQQTTNERATIRVVLDTNVFLDLVHWHDPHALRLQKAITDQTITLLWSEDTLAEVVDVLQRSHFGWTETRLQENVPVWLNWGIALPQTKIEQIRSQLTIRCKDPLDQKFLELCVAGQAHYLFTKDKLVLKSLRKLARFGLQGGLPEATPRQWTVPTLSY